MANVLIIDLLEESCYLMRSLLRGKGHSASIAINADEARTKMNTGLFDALFVDLCEPNEENKGLVSEARAAFPELPVIGLTQEEGTSEITDLGLSAVVTRPIRGARITNAVDGALGQAASKQGETPAPRQTVDYAVTLEIDGQELSARVTDITLKGFAIDAGGADFTEDRLQQLRELDSEVTVIATINPTKKETLKATGKIAFVDRFKRFNGKMVGLVFEELDEALRTHLATLFQIPLEAIAGGEQAESEEEGQLGTLFNLADAQASQRISEAA